MKKFYFILLLCFPLFVIGQAPKPGTPFTYENAPKKLAQKVTWLYAYTDTISVFAFKTKEWPGVDTVFFITALGKDTIKKEISILTSIGAFYVSPKDMNRYNYYIQYIKKGKVMHTYSWEYQRVIVNKKEHLVVCEE